MVATDRDKINFQPDGSTIPDGYTADLGEAYDSALGYGWVTQDSASSANPEPLDITQYGRDRNQVDDQKLDTLLHMQPSDADEAAAWEYEVSNGTYDILVSVGDSRYLDSTHAINIEGIEVIAPFQPSRRQRHQLGIATVEVDDGKLTVDADGGSNTKINYIEFEPSSIGSSIDMNEKINFQSSAAEVPEGYSPDVGAAYSSARGYGWVTQGSAEDDEPTPLDITQYGRDRNRAGDQRVDTFVHMQASSPNAAWEYDLPDGTYSVTVGVGDPSHRDSQHDINVEGVSLIDSFNPTRIQEFQIATTTVTVDDGRLTIDAAGGDNTKINYVEIENIPSGLHPRVTGTDIASDSTGVYLDAAINGKIQTVVSGEGVDEGTLSTDSVQLYRTRNGALVPGEVETSGGNDTIVYQPFEPLEPRTNYTFRVTSDVTDEVDNSFLPYSTTFNTGVNKDLEPTPGVEFDERVVYGGEDVGAPISTLYIGPDRRLYAADLDGGVHRWKINDNGTLANEQVFRDEKLEGRAIIGIAVNPDFKNELFVWTTNNDPIPGPRDENAEDFSGKISKLFLNRTGSGFEAEVEDYVVGLPRSAKDHLSNSLVFGPDEDPGPDVERYLYMTQGSNSAMGAPDNAWGNRPERLLSASVLKIDPSLTPPEGGFDVQTEDYNGEEGNYDPYAPDAPVTLFATGIRNAYDLIWHSNGYLYVPSNGSAAGGNTPDDPSTPEDEGLQNVDTQNDYLFKIDPEGGGYYGHPNPTREEYILNGGNPTSGVDPAEVVETEADGERFAGYPVGIDPDPNYEGFAYDFGRNRSPNGIIEYKSTPSEFGDALKGQLLVVEYSGGNDILALDPGPNGDIPQGSATQAAAGFNNPLDLIEDTRVNLGNLYVAELFSKVDDVTKELELSGQITLLEPTV